MQKCVAEEQPESIAIEIREEFKIRAKRLKSRVVYSIYNEMGSNKCSNLIGRNLAGTLFVLGQCTMF